MTMIRGCRIMAAPCCGAQYRFPQYLSMNFSALEYWTDGWREESLMPNDEGLRQCRCGQFVLINDLRLVEVVEDSNLPWMQQVADVDVPACIAKASSQPMEIAARRRYWRLLNRPYREQYRAQREAEEAQTRAQWEIEHPDRRSRLDKLLGKPAPEYRRSPDSPFTVPDFVATPLQTTNMQRLIALFEEQAQEVRSFFAWELVELYRETGQFFKAQAALKQVNKEDDEVLYALLSQLIRSGICAPMRY